MAETKLQVQDIEVRLFVQKDEDYICITDITRKFNPVPTDIIKAWMRNRNTVEFIGTWEMLHNPSFNLVEFDQIKMQSLNAEFIRLEYSRDNRIRLLHNAARKQMEVIAGLAPVEHITKMIEEG